MLATVQPQTHYPLGVPVPSLAAHAISVSLPTWEDNVGYEEGDERVVGRMQTGYPRFFIHRSIQKLANICVAKFGLPNELCLLLPSPTVAQEARAFLASQSPPEPSRIVEFVVCPSAASLIIPAPSQPIDTQAESSVTVDIVELQILLFDTAHWKTAKAFWQHTGDFVSSRLAERALAFLGETPAGSIDEVEQPASAVGASTRVPSKAGFSRNRHYAARKPTSSAAAGAKLEQPSAAVSMTTASADPDLLSPDHSTYLEERYGRNMPLFNAPLAKLALRRRIAGILLPCEADTNNLGDVARGTTKPSALAGGRKVQEDDVFIYPTGMSAIWHAHKLARTVRERSGQEVGKSVCYGFPYIDTLKILQKWGPGCHFFGQGTSKDIDALQQLLEETQAEGSTTPKVLSLFCEFPTNPLLRSPDLERLRVLADRFGFLIVVDETVGNFVNVEIAQWADVVVSSLTKIFSGDANVMGGSLVLNPNAPFYESLKATLNDTYEDNYFPEDAIFLERNSRDYRGRIAKINDNAYDLTAYLVQRSIAHEAAEHKVLKQIYYPRYITADLYAKAQRFPTTGKGGFGGLFTMTFVSTTASRAFFDTLACAKGPSLGTNFTLASPYALLAHYFELDWAAQFGVEKDLVRVSVGLEEYEGLQKTFEVALDAAERAQAELDGRA